MDRLLSIRRLNPTRSLALYLEKWRFSQKFLKMMSPGKEIPEFDISYVTTQRKLDHDECSVISGTIPGDLSTVIAEVSFDATKKKDGRSCFKCPSISSLAPVQTVFIITVLLMSLLILSSSQIRDLWKLEEEVDDKLEADLLLKNNALWLDSTSPSNKPSVSTFPSSEPSLFLSVTPSYFPSNLPSYSPSETPSSSPSEPPSLSPSSFPSVYPTTSSPSHPPTSIPSSYPSIFPSLTPSATTSYAPSDFSFQFAVTGDVPYTLKEEQTLALQLVDLEKSGENISFLIHLGDINQASEETCNHETFSNVHWILRRNSPNIPIFIIPGDNDWLDCPNGSDKAWQAWTDNFLYFDQNWDHQFNVERLASRPENFSFLIRNSVLFVGLNIPGSRNYDSMEDLSNPFEWENRIAEEFQWAKTQIYKYILQLKSIVLFIHARPRDDFHGTFKDGLKELSKELKLPILLLHGDGHTWQYRENSWSDYITRVQVDQGGDARPVKVVVKDDDSPFTFYR